MAVEMGIARITLTESQMHDIIEAANCDNGHGVRVLEWLRADLQRILGINVVIAPRDTGEEA